MAGEHERDNVVYWKTKRKINDDLQANMTELGAGGGNSGEPAQTADNPFMAVIANLQPLPAAASASAATIPAVDEPSKSSEPRGGGLSIGPLMLKQMEDKVVEEAQPLDREQYKENSPSGNVLHRAARKTAAVWKTVKRFKDVSLMGKILCNDEGRDVYQYSYVCVFCWGPLKMTFDKSRKACKTSAALEYLKEEQRKESLVAKEGLRFEHIV